MLDNPKTFVEKIVAELKALKKLIKKKLLLGCLLGAIGVLIGLAWLAPKAWAVLKVLANPEISELRQKNVILTSKEEEMHTTINELLSQLAQRTKERDTTSEQLNTANAFTHSYGSRTKTTNSRARHKGGATQQA